MIFTRHPLEHMLLLSSIIFCSGVYTILTRKNAVSILMGVELVLNAANINFVAFSQYTRIGGIHGNVFTISCDDCVMQDTPACEDCVVTFICGREPGEAVVIDVAEARAVRLLGEAGLVPPLRRRVRAAY